MTILDRSVQTGDGLPPATSDSSAAFPPTRGGATPALSPRRSGSRRFWWKRPGILAALAALAAATGSVVFSLQPRPVSVVFPASRPVVETVAASGRVGGRREIAVGARTSGIVSTLYVDSGDRVRTGQSLARIDSTVADAQVLQAMQAVATARAALAQAQAPVLASEIDAARARVGQAEAAVNEAKAQVARAQAALHQTEAGAGAARARLYRSASITAQAEARYQLAVTTLVRQRDLLREGAVARQVVDEATAERDTAAAAVTAAQHDRKAAEAEMESARSQAATARHDLEAARSRVAVALSATHIARADLRTLQATPRSEAVALARRRAEDAEAALAVARAQTASSLVVAPFDGTVTARLTEPGGAITGGDGVVRLVETVRPEVRADVDENELPTLRIGQRAVITSSAYPDARVAGRLTRIGAQVDPQRGTVEVTVLPSEPPGWLWPGQTVDVSLIVSEEQRRLVVPTTALRLQEDGRPGRSVFVIREGRAVSVPISVGAADSAQVPVLSGLSPNDVVVADASGTVPGARVRPVRRSGRK